MNQGISTPAKVVRFAFIAEPGCEDHATVRVLIEKSPPGCSVADPSPGLGVTVSCSDVGQFIRAKYKLPPGGIVSVSFAWKILPEEFKERVGSIEVIDMSLLSAGFDAGSTECYVRRPDNGGR